MLSSSHSLEGRAEHFAACRLSVLGLAVVRTSVAVGESVAGTPLATAGRAGGVRTALAAVIAGIERTAPVELLPAGNEDRRISSGARIVALVGTAAAAGRLECSSP